MARPLEGKSGVILGVANERSIAWHIAKTVHEQGARVALNYQGERLAAQVKALGAEIDAFCAPCDLAVDSEIDVFFGEVGKQFDGKIDFMVHSVAFANRDELSGRFMNTSREGFALALDISVYTLAAAARRAFPLLQASGGGSILTLSYFGAEKVIPNYNVMGVAKAALEASVRYLANDLGPDNITVNALSAGPLRTLASRGISQFADMIAMAVSKSPMKKNIEIDEVADAAAFLVSNAARGITGEVMHVDRGYNIMGF